MEQTKSSPSDLSFLDILQEAPSTSGQEFEIVWSQIGRHKTALVQTTAEMAIFIKVQGQHLNLCKKVSLDEEIRFYKSFKTKNISEEFQCFIPRLIDVIDERALLFEGYFQHLNLHSALLDQEINIDLFRKIGKFLAALHSVIVEESHFYRNISCPVVTHGHITPEVFVNKPPSYVHLLPLIQQAPKFNIQLRNLRESWRSNRFIHGDFKVDNILVFLNETQADNSPLVVDWELFGIGDSNWDCGSLIGSIYLTWLKRNYLKDKNFHKNDQQIFKTYVKEFFQAYVTHYKGNVDTGLIFGWAGYWIIQKTLEALPPHKNLSRFELASMHLAQQLLMEYNPQKQVDDLVH